MEKNRDYSVIAVKVIVVVWLLLVVGAIWRDHQRHLQVVALYDAAIDMISARDYAAATSNFDKICELNESDYRDTVPFQNYCDAKLAYQAGNVHRADDILSDNTEFNYQTNDWLSSYRKFVKQVAWEKQVQDIQKQEADRQAAEDKIRKGVPYIGMSESRITDTSLGCPEAAVRHNSECINGQQYTANLYDFKRNGWVIFTARCINGKVTDVWDKRDMDTSKPPKSSSGSSHKRYYEDDYNVNDYYDAEDFYEDYFDDFEDYEDAEDYFDDYHD